MQLHRRLLLSFVLATGATAAAVPLVAQARPATVAISHLKMVHEQGSGKSEVAFERGGGGHRGGGHRGGGHYGGHRGGGYYGGHRGGGYYGGHHGYYGGHHGYYGGHHGYYGGHHGYYGRRFSAVSPATASRLPAPQMAVK